MVSKKIKWSKILHGISAVSGILGLVALVVFWVAASNDGVSLFSQDHAYEDAVVLLLVSIAFGIGTLIHLKEERK